MVRSLLQFLELGGSLKSPKRARILPRAQPSNDSVLLSKGDSEGAPGSRSVDGFMPKIIVYDGESESEYALSDSTITIGRVAKTCEVVIKVPEASRQHCRIKTDGGSWFVEDLGSSNGTRVNGRKVTTFELADGDEIQVGKATLRFLESEVVAPMASTADDIELEISLEEESWLKFLSGERAGERINLAGRLTIGRRSSNDIALTEKGISGSHVEIVADGSGWLLRDLGSTNGTMVNGVTAVEARLESGDRVRVGVVEFLYGEGEDAGDDLVGTVSFQEVDLDDEVFAISQGNFRKKQKSALVLTLFCMVAVVGCGAWWVMQGTAERESSQRVEIVSGNILGAAGTFEPSDAEDEPLANDSDSLEYDMVAKRPHSGSQALEVRGGGEGDHRIVFLSEIQSVSSADRISLGGQIRNGGVSGAVGLDLLWKAQDGRVLGSSHLNAPEGSGSWTEIRGIFRPPFGTDRAAIAVAYHDANGTVSFDDVYALRNRRTEEDLVINAHELLLDRSAALAVTHVGSEIFDQGGFWLLQGNQPRFLDRLFAADSAQEGLRNESVSGTYIEGPGLSGGSASVQLEPTAGGVVWRGQTTASGPLYCGLRVSLDEGLVTVGSDGAQRHNSAFERAGVKQVILASGSRALRLRFAEAQKVKLVEYRQVAVLLLPLAAADGGLGFEIPIQIDFSTEINEANELMQAAMAADTSGRYGEAMAKYEDVINRFSFNKDLAERAQQRIGALSLRAETDLQSLTTAVDDVIFFQTFGSFQEPLTERLQAGITAFANSSYEASFTELLEKLNDGANQLSAARKLQQAEVQLARGRDLMTPGRSAPVLAKGFFESVIELVPDSELSETARNELKKIEAILGRN